MKDGLGTLREFQGVVANERVYFLCCGVFLAGHDKSSLMGDEKHFFLVFINFKISFEIW